MKEKLWNFCSIRISLLRMAMAPSVQFSVLLVLEGLEDEPFYCELFLFSQILQFFLPARSLCLESVGMC